MDDVSALDEPTLAFLATARRATLGTIAPSGRPRLVPICFIVAAPEPGQEARLYSPLDEKSKASADPLDLARVRDIVARPEATLLVDRWSEDWSRLGWVRLDCRAELLEPAADREHRAAVAALREKYPPYRDHDLDHRPLLRFSVERVVSWGDLAPGTAPGRGAGGSGSSSSPGGSRPR